MEEPRFTVLATSSALHPFGFQIWDNVERTWYYIESGPWHTSSVLVANAKAKELNKV